jgi:hypothetical protein
LRAVDLARLHPCAGCFEARDCVLLLAASAADVAAEDGDMGSLTGALKG